VRARAIEGWHSAHTLSGVWKPTAHGYSVRLVITIPASDDSNHELSLGLVVNEMPVGRERRRGQLVLGGKPGFVYLRGDREDREQFPRFIIER
jgi:hypothetical protein